ncbi:MAG: pre-peptidase C-terminal domain-containing protein [Bryobacterales bacterium]|nr:pre-peptidase C-terminal domain-containing protein [Bryobacterales bacterium]
MANEGTQYTYERREAASLDKSLSTSFEREADAVPPQATTVLQSGVPAPFIIGPVAQATLMSQTGAFQITVPNGATKLDIQLVTSTPNVDVDLYARANMPPDLAGGQVVCDVKSDTYDTGNELVSITTTTSPRLQPGVYYITLGLYTPGFTASGTVTATITGGGTAPPPPPPSGGTVTLTSGVPASFNFQPVSTPTLMSQTGAFQVTVPHGSSRLEVRVVTSTPAADVDLFVRFGRAPELSAPEVVADFQSAQSGTGNETVTITTGSSPPLQAGTYYITLGLFSTGMAASGTVTATITGGTTPPPPSSDAVPLTLGVPASFSLAAASTPTLMSATGAYKVTVPSGAVRLVIQLVTTTPGADVDLYVRFGAKPEVSGGRVVCDHKSEQNGTGDETVTITPASVPALQAGLYYITLGLYSTGVAAQGTLKASLDSGESTLQFFNGAGFQKDWISPGSIATIAGPGLAAGLQGCVSPDQIFGPLPFRLANVSVSFGGWPAPIYHICNALGQQSVTVQVPFEVPPGITQVKVSIGAVTLTAPSAPLREVSPGILETLGSDGRTRAVLLRPDNTFVTPANPARRGEILRAYAVGLGPTSPPVGTNQPGGPAGEAAVMNTLIVGVNNAGAPLVSAVYARGLIGVYEVSFEVPSDTPSSDNVAFAIAVVIGDSLVFGNPSSFSVR